MIGALTLYQTSIGKKVIMALTGVVLYGYVMIHMLGNLKIFAGRDYINAYGAFLREAGGPLLAHEQLLWTARVVLLVSVVLHFWAAYELARMDWAGRPVRYASRKNQESSFASRTMKWGGVIILLFIVYHVLHLTTGTVHPSYVEGDVYNNLVAGFRQVPASLFYIVAMGAVGLHLYHGVWSMFQTLGLNNSANKRIWRGLAVISSIALVVGNVSIPIAVLLGIVR